MSEERPDPVEVPAADDASSAERRRVQRFVARRRGDPCFFALIGGARVPLNDLSAEGFSMQAAQAPALGEAFAFVLQREGVPDEIRGRAIAANFIPPQGGELGQAGCRFVDIEADGAERVRDWLIAHVIMTASVRISEKDAAAIVAGPSLI